MAVDKGYIASFGSKYAAMLDLSRIYKIHVTQIYKIVNRQSWKTVS
jgi:Mor family transcriptional regulator